MFITRSTEAAGRPEAWRGVPRTGPRGLWQTQGLGWAGHSTDGLHPTTVPEGTRGPTGGLSLHPGVAGAQDRASRPLPKGPSGRRCHVT